MKSIRLYLLLSLLATITLVNFVALLHGYQSSMKKAEALFDDRLSSTARLIAAANTRRIETDFNTEQNTPYTYFQILSRQSLLILMRSANAPRVVMGDIVEGFQDINVEGYRWRQYVYEDKHLQRWIIVAERLDIRYSLAEEVVLESLTPIVLSIPLAALLIWFLVGIGLKPLKSFARQIRLKKADDLTPVVMNNLPDELTTLYEDTNALLARLDDAFAREQRFSADAAHELRTPVSVLKVHLHNLQQQIGNDNADLAMLDQAIERMGHLIEQILALYRTSPDQASVKFEPTDLYQITQNLIAHQYDRFDDKQQIISLHGEEGIVHGNRFALETLINNLLSNANKYTPEGGQVTVSLFQDEQRVSLTIEDSGEGIPESQYDRVFERFYRVNGDQHQTSEVGCGLGLTIVKHIVMLHQAEIMLRSSDLGGLCVQIDFPREI